MAALPLSFLALPTELRLLIYERINPTIQHHTLNKPITPGENKHTSRSKLILCTAILATCRQIKSEAQPIFDKKFPDLHSQPVRFHVDLASALDLAYKTSPHVACFGGKTPSWVNGWYTLTRKPYEPVRRPGVQPRMILLHTATNCNVDEFVNRSLRAVTRAKKEPLTPARPYDVEIILSQDVEGWNPQIFSMFLHDFNRVAVRARIAIVVKSKVPDLHTQPKASSVREWKFWKLIYDDVVAMPARSRIQLEDIDIDEDGEVVEV